MKFLGKLIIWLLIALLLVIAWERHFFRRQSAAVRTVKESA